MHNSQVLKTTSCLNLRGSAHSLLLCSQDSLIQSQGCRVWITAVSHLQSPNMYREFGGIKQGDVLSTTFKNWLCDKSQHQGNLAIRKKRQPRKSLWDRRDNRKQENGAGVKQGLTKQGRAKNSASCLSRCCHFTRRQTGCIFFTALAAILPSHLSGWGGLCLLWWLQHRVQWWTNSRSSRY